MTWYKKAEIDKEMFDFHLDRTNEHIDLVRKYCKKIYDHNSKKFSEIILKGQEHDLSKFQDPEKEPYVYVSWKHKRENEGEEFHVSDDIKKKMTQATEHHCKSNSHHPEFHCDKKTNIINKENREPPSEIIDATKMGDLDIAEMCADWCAMSKELDNTPKAWAKKNINVRWKFNKKQVDLIYDLINAIWK